jgi:hypothetical protein
MTKVISKCLEMVCRMSSKRYHVPRRTPSPYRSGFPFTSQVPSSGLPVFGSILTGDGTAMDSTRLANKRNSTRYILKNTRDRYLDEKVDDIAIAERQRKRRNAAAVSQQNTSPRPLSCKLKDRGWEMHIYSRCDNFRNQGCSDSHEPPAQAIFSMFELWSKRITVGGLSGAHSSQYSDVSVLSEENGQGLTDACTENGNR